MLAFAREHAKGADEGERAVALNLAVRDGFRYNPYRIDLSLQGLRASSVLEKGYGWCVPWRSRTSRLACSLSLA